MATLSETFDPRNNSIGAIRLVCASAVVVGHVAMFAGYRDPSIWSYTGGQVTMGRLSVDIFFILSGFLLARSWQHSKPLDYARNRFLRIYPGLWACLIVTGLIMPLCFGFKPAYEYVTKTAPLIFGFYNGRIPGLFTGNVNVAPNSALWTLSGEIYCYASIPVVATLGLLNKKLVPFVLATLWIGFVITLATALGHAAIISWWRLFTFFYVGVVFYLYRDHLPMNAAIAAICAIALAAATIVGTFTFRHPGGLFYVFAPLPLGYIILYLATSLPFRNIDRKVDLSYGIYIYGTFILQMFVWFGFRAENSNYWVLALTVLATSAAVAALSWFLVEKPALSLKTRRGQKTDLTQPTTKIAPPLNPIPKHIGSYSYANHAANEK